MPAKKYRVDLTAAEQEELLTVRRHGKAPVRKVPRARSLLQATDGLTDDAIAEALGTRVPTVERTRQRFVEENLGALGDRPRPGQPRPLDGKAEAPLVAVTCSPAPAGRERWTLRLRADQAVELGLAEALSYERVRQVLKKTHSNRGSTNSGVSPRSVPTLSPTWKMCSTSMLSPTIPSARKSTSTRRANN